jgi:N-acetylglucosaminyldiphosphoundecaprenol N-acetyl-beta-D-mannosaminyltransferase
MWRRYLSTNSEFVWLAGREILARRRLAGEPPGIPRGERE